MKNKRILTWIAYTCIIVLLSACMSRAHAPNEISPSHEQQHEIGQEPVQEPEPEPVEPEPQPYSLRASLIAVGDIMMHSPQIPAGYDPVTGTYNYDSFFAEVKDILSEGDWVYGNLETPLAGEDLGGYSGYPMFNAPDALADSLKTAGFNIVSTANNHSMDRRGQGVLRTLEALTARELLAIGTYSSQEDRDTIQIVEKNGIFMAFLAYTYGTNGIPVPDDQTYLVNPLDTELMIQDIHHAKQLGADVVTIALHFGNEYERNPNDHQKELVRQLIQEGADIILGSHPHVVQPYEVISVTKDGTERTGFVIYSLGNFISNQGPAQQTPKYTDVGVILKLDIAKHFPEQTIEIEQVSAIPTWVHKYQTDGKRHYRVLPLPNYLQLPERSDPILTASDWALMSEYDEEIHHHLRTFMNVDVPVTLQPALLTTEPNISFQP
ncbi:CapA family protein [Marinicrinis lubricantis]|uniref:CapA family protein n=1 Tax=Marinicrinis lubricantis TaxID=2086470 RepID=A0ABW1ILZ1_9BACL